MQSNVSNRHNKQAKGFTKHYERRERMGRKLVLKKSPTEAESTITKLIVRGTLDHLARTNFFFKKVMVEHPIDKGYFKEVYILTDSGKARLRTMKKLKASSLPFWEYMYKVETE